MPERVDLHHMASLEEQIGQLDAASRQAGKELLFAAAPAVMTFLGWMGIRKQRRAMREALAELEAIDARSRDIPEEPAAEPAEGEGGGPQA